MLRKTPMKRTGFARKPDSPFSSLANRQTALRRTEMKRRVKKQAPKAEREHMGVIAGLFCIVCRNLRLGESPAEVHHVRFLAGGGQRAGNLETIPLCPMHHRLGGFGVAIHAGRKTWEAKYGTEAELLEQTKVQTAQREAA